MCSFSPIDHQKFWTPSSTKSSCKYCDAPSSNSTDTLVSTQWVSTSSNFQWIQSTGSIDLHLHPADSRIIFSVIDCIDTSNASSATQSQGIFIHAFAVKNWFLSSGFQQHERSCIVKKRKRFSALCRKINQTRNLHFVQSSIAVSCRRKEQPKSHPAGRRSNWSPQIGFPRKIWNRFSSSSLRSNVALRGSPF